MNVTYISVVVVVVSDIVSSLNTHSFSDEFEYGFYMSCCLEHISQWWGGGVASDESEYI